MMNHKIKLYGEALPESEYGTPYFWFDSLSGTEKINELFEYQLIVKVRDQFLNPVHGYRGLEGFVSKLNADNGATPGSNLNLQSLVGTELTVAMQLDGSKLNYSLLGLASHPKADENDQTRFRGERYYRGLVSRVEVLPVRNRHATYKITLVPWLWLLTKTKNYKIFQNKSVIDILEEVLYPYPYPVEYRCSEYYPALDFQVQYNEDSLTFIQRLMQEFGLNFHFEHSKNHLTLVISDHNAAFKEMQSEGYRELTIYPPNQRFPERAEYIEFFEPAQQLVSGKVQLSDYQFKQPSLRQTAQDQFVWDHHFAQQEIYEWQQGDFFSAEKGGNSKARQRVEQLYQHGYRAHGQGHLKGLQTGFRFNLSNHPNDDSNRGWLVLGTQTTIQDISEEQNQNHFYDSKVEFVVQPDEHIFRPDLTRSKPLGRPQTAIVVGPSGEEIYTDEYGRVKVKFHWDRLHPSEQAQKDIFSNAMASRDETNTCWLRVSTAWAGHQFGTLHLPRIGQEVIVDFFNGDPDMPFVAGRLTNPENMPLWDLPSQKALSGIKSKELGGIQSNQLVMDDTQGEVQVQLKSDHQASELNLGHITRIPDAQGRKDYRGEGFELRTDGHGVLRAGSGLILSTFSRLNAKLHVKDIVETLAHLSAAKEQQKNTLEMAIKHHAVEGTLEQTVSPQLDEQYATVKGEKNGGQEFTELSQNHLIVSSAQDVVIAADKVAHVVADQVAITSKNDTTFSITKGLIASVAQGIRLFSQSKGIKLFSALDPIELESQNDDIRLTSAEDIHLQAKKKMYLDAGEELLINVGGSYLKITGQGIEHGTPGNWTAYAQNHHMQIPKNMAQQFNEMPRSDFDQELLLRLPNGKPARNMRYELHHQDGSVTTGITDANGSTQLQKAKSLGNYRLKILGKIT